MIIVDDCSTDDSVERIEAAIEGEPRIRLLRLQSNVGAAEARNYALRRAAGRYIAFLDSDDMWTRDKLRKQIAFMNERECGFSFGNYIMISENGERHLAEVKVPASIGYRGLLGNTIIGTLTVMIDRQKTGPVEMPNIRTSHDLALWLSMLKKGIRAYGVGETLGFYRVISSSNTANKLKAAMDVWNVYRSVERLSVLRSGMYFVSYAFNAARKRML